ncbi:MAG: aromatic ring-hydroxylating oxygenase subunit alpha [Immundisolibacter sp.]|uniref:aromatic ring-hydroxylating oxygenase subunit alpha n=1 Tax=Immundisolibacter sp. TaxID=1934948 RepID=UPI003EE2106F
MNQPVQIVQHLTGASNVPSGPLPIGEFFTPEYFALEKERVFKKSWLRVGLEQQLVGPGDYFVKELEVCDTSVLVVRGRDQRIRAFHNACSHRTNRVAYAPSGNVPGFTCRFHSWSYGLDGSLVTVPEEHLFPNLCKAEHGLTEVACDTWEGFIFVNVDPQPAKTLREYLGEDIYSGFGGFFPQFEFIGRFSAIVPANWKIVLDAFVESYHFSTVHGASAGDIAISRENPNGRVDAARLYASHRAVSATSNIQHTPTFAETLARKYSGNATLAPDMAKQGQGNPPQINPLQLPDWLTDIMIIFPMCNLQSLQGFFVTQDYWPLSHDRTRWDFMVHMRPPQDAAGEVAAEYNRAYLRDVIREDLPNLAMIQTNLRSGAKKHQQVGEMEIMVRHAYKVLADQIGHGW